MPRPIPSPAPVTIATRPSMEKRSRITPGRGDAPRRSRCKPERGAAGHQGHVEVGEQAGLGPADVGDGVDAVHGGGDDPGIADETGLHRLGVQLLEGGEAARDRP